MTLVNGFNVEESLRQKAIATAKEAELKRALALQKAYFEGFEATDVDIETAY